MGQQTADLRMFQATTKGISAKARLAALMQRSLMIFYNGHRKSQCVARLKALCLRHFVGETRFKQIEFFRREAADDLHQGLQCAHP